jgi:hypothetical protein
MQGYEYSPLQDVFLVGDEQIQVHIYRNGNEDWTLHLFNSNGASKMWANAFSDDISALEHFKEASSNGSIEFTTDLQKMKQGLSGFNNLLLQPQYAWYRDLKTKTLYTLCKFDLLQKYAGLWPAQNLMGHKVTGYLYKGDAPQWPHLPKGLPSSPKNIEMEFTVLPKHIDFYVVNDLGLRDSSYW